MDGSTVLTGWGVLMLGIPVIGILVLAMFGMDERCFSPRRNARTRRYFCEVGGSGGSFFSDPDGRAWQKGPIRRIEARLIGGELPGREGANPGTRADGGGGSVIRGYIVESD